MNISYDCYRVFYYAAKYRSFSNAAAALHNNQPNISRIIRRLESELRCALFFRSPQGVRLTPEGEKLYAHISLAFENIKAAEDEISSDQSLQSGVVHIAASGLGLRSCLLRVLERYRSEYPYVRICLINNFTQRDLAAVQNGLADFALVPDVTDAPDSLIRKQVGQVREIPICGSAFSELTKGNVTLAQLVDFPLISLSEGTSTYNFYANLFLRHGLPYSPDVEVATIDQVLPVVHCNLGIGFVPHEMLVGSSEQTGIYPLTLEEPITPRSICLFRRKNQPLSIAARRLEQMLLSDFSRGGTDEGPAE